MRTPTPAVGSSLSYIGKSLFGLTPPRGHPTHRARPRSGGVYSQSGREYWISPTQVMFLLFQCRFSASIRLKSFWHPPTKVCPLNSHRPTSGLTSYSSASSTGTPQQTHFSVLELRKCERMWRSMSGDRLLSWMCVQYGHLYASGPVLLQLPRGGGGWSKIWRLRGPGWRLLDACGESAAELDPGVEAEEDGYGE